MMDVGSCGLVETLEATQNTILDKPIRGIYLGFAGWFACDVMWYSSAHNNLIMYEMTI
jgi:hypothetical protein